MLRGPVFLRPIPRIAPTGVPDDPRPAVVPAAVAANDTVNTVYVGNLCATVDEYVLACTFVHFGPITNVQVRAAVACSSAHTKCDCSTPACASISCCFNSPSHAHHAQVIREKGTNMSKGYGFVTFAHPVYATLAMQNMNQQASGCDRGVRP